MKQVPVTSLNLNGEGLLEGSHDGLAFALPGDGYDVESHKVIPSSPDRQAAPCPHFGKCGGCALQHASDGFVAAWKQEITRKALAAHGIETDFHDIITSPLASRRRAVFAARRTKKTCQIGFHERRSDVLVPITECGVLAPEILRALPVCEEITRLGASRSASIRISVTTSLGGLDIAVSDAKELDVRQMSGLSALAHAHKLARVSWNGETLLRLEPAYQRFGKADVEPPPLSFLQATLHGEAALLSGLREAVGDAVKIVDLFAGCGTFALPLAEKADVLAVESEGEMLLALDTGWRRTEGLRQIETETRDLFRRPLLAAEFKGFDAVTIDPPRAGATAQVSELAASAVARIGFASCNPVSFARDAKVLCDAGFNLNWVQVIDQFRWSPHVELVAEFTR